MIFAIYHLAFHYIGYGNLAAFVFVDQPGRFKGG